MEGIERVLKRPGVDNADSGQGGAISVPQGAGTITVGSDGTINAGGAQVGRLQLANFERTDTLRRVGPTLFEGDAPQAPPASVRVDQGFREGSNVQAVQEMISMMLGMRHYEAAERVFQSLVSDYYDWNEVRVSTVRELAEVCKPLNDPIEAATRIKRVLQSVFETHYSFDLEPLKKQNIGAAVKTLEKYNGSSPFVVAFVTQQALGGHSIPTNQGLLESLRIVGVMTR